MPRVPGEWVIGVFVTDFEGRRVVGGIKITVIGTSGIFIPTDNPEKVTDPFFLLNGT